MLYLGQSQILVLTLFLLLTGGCDDNNVNEEEWEEMLSHSFFFNEKSYAIFKEAISWQDAVSRAVASGGYLAEINSEEEQTAIFSVLVNEANINFDDTNNQFGYAAIWLGGNDIYLEGKWVWNGDNDETETQFWEGGVDGKVVDGSYSNWGNEPDNNGGQDELCMGLEPTPINAAGKWTDLDGSINHLFYVVEYDE